MQISVGLAGFRGNSVNGIGSVRRLAWPLVISLLKRVAMISSMTAMQSRLA
jgi:hypothetical protein